MRIACIGCEINGEILCNVARELTNDIDGFLDGMKYLICDNDPVLADAFAEILDRAGVKVIRTRPGCPEQNGYAEAFVKTIKRECLDHFVFLGVQSVRRAISQFTKHYLHERNHQGLDNIIPSRMRPPRPVNPHR